MSVYEQKYGFRIIVYDGAYPNGEILEMHFWKDYLFHTFSKWMWYFEYRTALARVRYPRNYIRSGQFTESLKPKQYADILRNKIIAKKRRVTEVKNKMALAIEHWSELFPIENDEIYIRAAKKLSELESQLILMQREYDSIIVHNKIDNNAD